MKQGATALTSSEVLEQLSALILAKLSEWKENNCLLSSGSLVRT